MSKANYTIAIIPLVLSLSANANSPHSHTITDADIATQRAVLAQNTKDKGFGPQSPRDISATKGENTIAFGVAPHYKKMNLCNIHMHKNAEHKGGEFTKYAGNGDGHGYHTGYLYSGNLTAKQLKPLSAPACPSVHDSLQSGDTIEVHYVHSSAQVKPGASLGACLSESVKNPQLRVEAQVYVLVNDANALNFNDLSSFGEANGKYQALNLPNNTGKPVIYSGSTTGPSFNEVASPLQVTWSVRPKVAKVNIASIAQWCEGNEFEEQHAHGARNLVINPKLLSPIK